MGAPERVAGDGWLIKSIGKLFELLGHCRGSCVALRIYSKLREGRSK